MLQPTNSAAEQIVSLRSINGDIDTQIATLQASQQKNLDTITAFEEIATWVDVEEVPEAIVVEETPVVEETVVETVVPAEDIIADSEVTPEPIVEVVEEIPLAPVVEPVVEPAPSEPLIVSAPKPRSSKAKK